MRFKVDDDLPIDVAQTLRSANDDAVTVLEEHLGGAPDTSLWAAAQHETRCLVTADKGFADIRTHPPGTHAGVVLLRLPRESRDGYVQLIRAFIASFDAETVPGAIVVLAPEMIRVHRAAEPGGDVRNS